MPDTRQGCGRLARPFHAGEGVIRDIFFAIGLVLAFEGLICAAFPAAMRRAMLEAAQLPENLMRMVGVASALVGIIVLWLIKAS